MTETTQILLISLGVFIVAYAALPFIVRPKWKDLHGMANGRNSLTFIHVDPDAPHKLAVVAHEMAEWQYKYRRPWLWAGPFRTDAAKRAINLWGPAVETAYAVKAYGVDEVEFIKKESATLVHRDYFQNWNFGRGDEILRTVIANEIHSRMPKAREWVGKNLKQIEPPE